MGSDRPPVAPAPTLGARALTALLGILVADFMIGLITGDASPLPLGSMARPGGVLIRGALILVAAVLRYAYGGPKTPDRAAWWVLGLCLLPTLAQFQLAGGRINGDGVMYYVYVRSLMKDGDLEFANEYAHYGILERDDLSMLTKTGRRRSIFAVGPGLAWIPFFALGEVVARGQHALGAEVDLSGYGPHHRNAVALGSLLYGFLTIALIHSMLRRHFAVATALGASLLVWGTTFLYWYMVQQPTMAHAPSAMGAALVIWLWDRDRLRRGLIGFLGLGLVAGLAMCLRWQNGVLLALPAFEILERARRERVLPRMMGAGGALLLGTLLGAVPQMLAWKYIYGTYLLPSPPHGADFLKLNHPYLLQTLFSSRHGLLSWTPVFWLGFLGFLPLLRRRQTLALSLALPLVLMTYVNACSGDWWAGGSFSIRRFDSQLPIFAFGFAAALEWLQEALPRAPALVPAGVALGVILWNCGLGFSARDGAPPTFPVVVGGLAQRFSHTLGSPMTWPASWLFSLRYRRPPGQFDLLVGRYLFYRQNNMKGRIDLGGPSDEAMLGEGWGPREVYQGQSCRSVSFRARAFAPLDVPENLGLALRTASGAGTVPVTLHVNQQAAGQFEAGPEWRVHEVYVPKALWRRELNEVAIEAAGVHVEMLIFVPRAAPAS